MGTPTLNEWLSGIESWKEVLQGAEAHIASCSATDDDGILESLSMPLKKGQVNLLDAGYTSQFELFHTPLRKSSTWATMLFQFNTKQLH